MVNQSPLLSISGVSAVGPLVTFYDIPGRKGEVTFYSSASNATQETDRLIVSKITSIIVK
jgi:hypothetical protein